MCVRGAAFGDLWAFGVFERAAFSCIGRGPVPVIRELHVRCACVCMFAMQSGESCVCVCAVFFVCGGLKSVEQWACPRLWRVGRGNVSVFWAVYAVDVRGGVCKCSKCQSVVFCSPQSSGLHSLFVQCQEPPPCLASPASGHEV